MGKFVFWQRWLFVVSIIIFIFGMMMALFNGTAIFRLFDNQINPVFWGVKNVDEHTGDFTRWIYGVLGATMAGWGIFIGFIARYPFRKKEKWASDCLLLVTLIWFLVDTGISLYFKVYFNAIFNTILLVMMFPPLLFTRKYFMQMSRTEQGS